MPTAFTSRNTQRQLRRMAAWYSRQEPINYFPQSMSNLDAYIFLTLDHPHRHRYSGNYYATLNL